MNRCIRGHEIAPRNESGEFDDSVEMAKMIDRHHLPRRKSAGKTQGRTASTFLIGLSFMFFWKHHSEAFCMF